MGAEARANAEDREDRERKVAELSEAILTFIDGACEHLDLDLTRVAIGFDVPSGKGHAVAALYLGPHDESPADEVRFAIQHLEATAFTKYGFSRKTVAECILGTELVETEPERRRRPTKTEPEQRPRRHIGQRNRRRGR